MYDSRMLITQLLHQTPQLLIAGGDLFLEQLALRNIMVDKGCADDRSSTVKQWCQDHQIDQPLVWGRAIDIPLVTREFPTEDRLTHCARLLAIRLTDPVKQVRSDDGWSKGSIAAVQPREDIPFD